MHLALKTYPLARFCAIFSIALVACAFPGTAQAEDCTDPFGGSPASAGSPPAPPPGPCREYCVGTHCSCMPGSCAEPWAIKIERLRQEGFSFAFSMTLDVIFEVGSTVRLLEIVTSSNNEMLVLTADRLTSDHAILLLQREVSPGISSIMSLGTVQPGVPEDWQISWNAEPGQSPELTVTRGGLQPRTMTVFGRPTWIFQVAEGSGFPPFGAGGTVQHWQGVVD